MFHQILRLRQVSQSIVTRRYAVVRRDEDGRVVAEREETVSRR